MYGWIGRYSTIIVAISKVINCLFNYIFINKQDNENPVFLDVEGIMR